MRVFVTGASGHIASAVVPELVAAGHHVVGLARSDTAASVVARRGGEVRRGDLGDLDGLAAAARDTDAVVHLAFDHDAQHSRDLAGAVATDRAAIDVLGFALAGTGKPFVGTNATGAMALAGFQGLLTEHDTVDTGFRVDAENAVIDLADHGVRASVVRLPPTVHSDGHYGFVSGLIDLARAAGMSGFLGDGGNRWPSADARDVARVYRFALESAMAGTRLHAVAEQGLRLREIADAIGRQLDVPVIAVEPENAAAHFGPLLAFVGLDNPTSSDITRDTFGWTPVHPGLLAALPHDGVS